MRFKSPAKKNRTKKKNSTKATTSIKKTEPSSEENLEEEEGNDPFGFLRSLNTTGSNTERVEDTEAVASNAPAHNASSGFDPSFMEREVDIARMVRGVLDESSLVPKDVKIDDGDMPLAKNFYEFCTKDEFIGTVMDPFLEQLIWGVITFGEYCGRCSDMHWLFDTHKVDDTFETFEKKVCMLEHGVCPSCGTRKSTMVNNEEMPFYNELAVNAGQRSGKSAAIGGMITPYITHRVLKMQRPNDVYGIAGSTMLHGTFVALTYAQAKDTLWEFYYGTLCESTWFINYHQLLRHYEEKYGQQLLKFNDTFVLYRPRNLVFYPAGPDKRVLRGRTRIFAGIDEIGWFDNTEDSKKIKTSAREVYKALDRSLLTVRGSADKLIQSGFDDILTGYAANVSSPSSQRDKICELVRQADDSTSMYGIHRPTWEVNPTLPKDSNVIVNEYRRDPIGAERDYAANPPLTANPYITNKDWIDTALAGKPNRIKLRPQVRNRKQQDRATKWADVIKMGKCRTPTVLAIDAGYTNNSFAGAIGSMSDSGDIKCYAVFEIIPEQSIPLNYTKIMESVIEEVIIYYNVQVMLADRWNSIKVLQDAQESHEIVSEQYSLKYKDIGLTRSHLEAGTITLPQMSKKDKKIDDAINFDSEEYPMCFQSYPVEHLVMQILTVQDTGTQVIKGDGLTDDLWRALCLMVWGVSNEAYAEYLSSQYEADAEDETFRPSAFASAKLGSGSKKSVGSGSGYSFPALGSYRRGR